MKHTETSLAQELLGAHRELMHQVRMLAQEVDERETTSFAVVRKHLEDIRTQVTRHFQFEEEGGYLSFVLETQPNLEQTVEHLQEEHSALRQAIDSIIAEARRAPVLDDTLAQKIRAWIKQLRHHEAHENALVQDAANYSDVGTGD